VRYVYGVVRAGHRKPARRGVGPERGVVDLVASGSLAAAVSDIATNQEITEQDARTHLHVLIDLLRSGPVLPIRLGTVVETDDDVRRDVLDANAADLAAALDGLDGFVEVHVDVDDDQVEALSAVASVPGLRDPGGSGVFADIERGRLIAQELVQRRGRLAEAIVARLRPLCVDDVPRATMRGPEDPLLRWAFLIRRDDLPHLDEAVGTLCADYPTVNVRYVGPLPPAHFLDRLASTPATTDPFRSDGTWGW
jgi:hypothetical protein